MRTIMTMRFLVAAVAQPKWTSILGVMLTTIAVVVPTRVVLGQTPEYIVTELTGEDPTQVPCKLNNLGDIVGRNAGNGEGTPRATLWDRDHSHSKKKHLGAFPGGDYSSATGINDAGEIAGVSNSGTAILPFVWTEKGGLRRLPLLPSDSSGQAVAINKHGHVVYDSSGPSGSRAVLWTNKTGLRNLGVLPGGDFSRARDLNDSDEVAGVSGSSDGQRAVLWTKSGSVRDLGTLPGDFISEARAINNAGDVVGYSKGPNGMRAFVWTKGGGMEEMGILPGGNSSRALAINDSDVVVGSSTSSSGDHAFVWEKQTGILDLNDTVSAALGIVLIEAHAINRKGQILAMGKMAHGIMASEDQVCAPTPPLSFLLTRVASH
jgi:probable HAF family extracellular repeat protein